MDYDLQIDIFKQEKAQLVAEMDKKKEEFLEELIIFSAGWFENETIFTVKENSEKLFELGEEKSKELKSEINALKEDSGKLVKKHLDVESLWWHQGEDSVPYYKVGNRLFDKHENEIKFMFGELGEILKKFGVIKISSSNKWINNGTKIKYSYGIDFSKKLYKLTGDYKDLISKSKEINRKIDALEEKKKKENVEDWWHSL